MEKKQRKLCVVMFILVVIAELVQLYAPKNEALVACLFVGPLAYSFIGLSLLSQRRRVEDWAGFAFMGWFIVHCMLYQRVNLLVMQRLFCAYGIFYAFARVADDGSKYTILRIVAWLLTAALSLLGWISVYMFICGKTISFSGLGLEFLMSSGRLQIINHPNTTATLFLLAIVAAIWLCLQDKKYRPVLIALAVGSYAGIALTVSRTVMIQAALTLGVLMGLWMLKRLSKLCLWQQWGLSVVGGLAMTVIAYVLFDVTISGIEWLSTVFSGTDSLVANRSLARDLTTMTGRTQIFVDTFHMLRDHPDVIFKGSPDWFELFRQYNTAASHTHNAYLQTLVMYGLPALAITLWMSYRIIRAGVRTAFSAQTALAEQFLCFIPILILISAIPEPFLFCDGYPFFDHFFLMFCGYALETERRLFPVKRRLR